MFVYLFSVLEHNRSLSYDLALKQSLMTASALYQRLPLANSLKDELALEKTRFLGSISKHFSLSDNFYYSLLICNLIESPCS